MPFPFRGYVEVIHGPMDSGKSTELLRRIRRLRAGSKPKRVLAVNHCRDTRGGSAAQIKTKNKETLDCEAHARLAELTAEQIERFDYVAVDEAQLFEHLEEDIKAIWAKKPGMRFILAGLTTYSNGAQFGELLDIIPWAVSTQLTAVCSFCGSNDATMTACTKQKDSDVTIGGQEKGFAAACPSCWSVESVS